MVDEFYKSIDTLLIVCNYTYLGMYQLLMVEVFHQEKNTTTKHCPIVWKRQNPSQPGVSIHLPYV